MVIRCEIAHSSPSVRSSEEDDDNDDVGARAITDIVFSYVSYRCAFISSVFHECQYSHYRICMWIRVPPQLMINFYSRMYLI